MTVTKNLTNAEVRIRNLLKLIGLLRDADPLLSVRQIQDRMQLSDSCIKNYLRALQDGGVIVGVDYKADRSHPYRVFQVIADQDKIDVFMEAQSCSPSRQKKAPQPYKRGPYNRKSQDERMSEDPNRHFHIAKDDALVNVKIPQQVAFYDQLHLPRDFFKVSKP